MLINGWHSDRTTERLWHSTIPLVAAGSMFGLLTVFRHEVPLAIACLLLGSGFFYAFYPVFWSIPTAMLSESAAAATFELINSIFNRATRRIGWTLLDRFSQRSKALTRNQLRVHRARLCRSGNPRSLSQSSRSHWCLAEIELARKMSVHECRSSRK